MPQSEGLVTRHARITYEVGFQEANGGLHVNSRRRSRLRVLDLVKILAHARQLLEDGMLSRVHSFKAQGGYPSTGLAFVKREAR